MEKQNSINRYLNLTDNELSKLKEKQLHELKKYNEDNYQDLILKVVENSFLLQELKCKLYVSKFIVDKLLLEKRISQERKKQTIEDYLNIIKSNFFETIKIGIILFIPTLLTSSNFLSFLKIILNIAIISLSSAEIIALYKSSNYCKNKLQNKITKIENDISLEKNKLIKYNNITKNIQEIYLAQTKKVEECQKQNKESTFKTNHLEEINQIKFTKTLVRKKEY